MSDAPVEASRLARRLGLFDAVAIGLAPMIGAGVFAAVGPAARAAGSGLLIGLAVAATVAYCNAAASARPPGSPAPGVGRTAFAMAADRYLPHWLDAVHPTHRVPHRAELAAGAAVVALVLVADLRGAIGFSSFTVLAYYGITNASAWTLPAEQRRWPRPLAAAGVVGCVLVAFTLPTASVVTGMVALGTGAVVWLRHRLVDQTIDVDPTDEE